MSYDQSDNFVAFRGKSREGAVEIRGFHKNVVGVESGNGKHTDPVPGENVGQSGEDPDQRKVQNTADPETFPAVVPVERVGRDGLRGTDQGEFGVGFADKAKFIAKVDLRSGSHLADGKNAVDFFQFHHHIKRILKIQLHIDYQKKQK